jgi:hypothetical protein
MTLIRHCSLWTGAALAKSLGACGDASTRTAKTDNALCSLPAFWNPSGRFVPSVINQRSGLDANPVFASIRTFDPAAGYDAVTFRPCSAPGVRRPSRLCRVLLGPYSRPTPPLAPDARIVVGRYLEDLYCDGNVRHWFLRSRFCVLTARCSPNTYLVFRALRLCLRWRPRAQRAANVLFRANATTCCGASITVTGAVDSRANRRPHGAVPRSPRKACPVSC